MLLWILLADLAFPAISVAEPAECTVQEWRILARAVRRGCPDCGELRTDVDELERCAFSRKLPDDCLGRAISSGLDRCQVSKNDLVSRRDFVFQPDCWGWEIRVERGRITRVEAIGNCD
jgi:predicted RNA-binding Zn-ribbon protein involved in translation (DUF1610 family)